MVRLEHEISSHTSLALLSSLDESELLHYLNPATCLMGADREQLVGLGLGLGMLDCRVGEIP